VIFNNSLLLDLCQTLGVVLDRLTELLVSLLGQPLPSFLFSDICQPLFGPGFQ
jgi:hypothetical protein